MKEYGKSFLEWIVSRVHFIEVLLIVGFSVMAVFKFRYFVDDTFLRYPIWVVVTVGVAIAFGVNLLHLVAYRWLPFRLTITLVDRLALKLIVDLAERARRDKEIAISITYLNHVNKGYARIKGFLLISAIVLLVLVHQYEVDALSRIFFIPLLLFGLLVLKEIVLEYRIKNGFFGTNAYEARTLINFLVANAADIDFTDSSGRPKRALMHERFGAEPGALASGQEAQP